MSYDYLDDLFGKARGQRTTRFSDVEAKAVGLIRRWAEGNIDEDAFAESFRGVQQEFSGLLGEGNAYTIDEDTPLWLLQFISNRFIRWHQFHQLKRRVESDPSVLSDEGMRRNYAAICRMGIDEEFMDACRLCLRELGAEG